jgi:hypothetical protein
MQISEMRVVLGITFPNLRLNCSKHAWNHQPATYFASLVKPWEVMRNAKHERQTFLSYFKPKGSILKTPNPLVTYKIVQIYIYQSYPSPKIVWNQSHVFTNGRDKHEELQWSTWLLREHLRYSITVNFDETCIATSKHVSSFRSIAFL